MKKFLVCLVCCFGIFTLCSATSTVGDVYLNEFDILVNEQSYSSALPILNYQGRTYLPLNEFGQLTKAEVKFQNNTIVVSPNITNQVAFSLYAWCTGLLEKTDTYVDLRSALDSYSYTGVTNETIYNSMEEHINTLKTYKNEKDICLSMSDFLNLDSQKIDDLFEALTITIASYETDIIATKNNGDDKVNYMYLLKLKTNLMQIRNDCLSLNI